MRLLSDLIPRRKAHFIGIGGVGMSALAQLLLAQGVWVSGSDVKESKATLRLETSGAVISIGHKAEHVSDVDVVVYSSCIGSDNPEIVAARQKNIRLIPRGLLLAYLMEGKSGIAVAGAHGKTTTTALISFLLQQNAMDPSFAVGADVDLLGGNARQGCGKFFVAEADESDGSFLHLSPEFAVITNIDKEHLDYYGDLPNIIRTYGKFMRSLRDKGALFCCGDDENIRKALTSEQGYKGRLITYGFSDGCDIRAVEVSCRGMCAEFDCIYQGSLLSRFKLNIPGVHNVLNALACVGVGRELGIGVAGIAGALEAFRGAQRRFQVKRQEGGIMVVDDYAHHPTEIMATLLAAKAWNYKRIVGVFQPHRYSRTKFLKEEFGRCFAAADSVVITDIYAASESPIEGIAAKTIYDEVKQSGHKDVHLLPKEKLNEYLLKSMRKGDVLMMLGAGDISSLTDELIKKMSANGATPGYPSTGSGW